MSDIFISYVEEDSAVAVKIAQALELEGYTTWYYGRDSLPGGDYLEVVFREIKNCKAVILIISPESVKSPQVPNEVVNAYESGRILMPLLLDFTWENVEKVRPAWKQALGAIVAVKVDPQNPAEVVRRLVAGLKAKGVESSAVGDSPVSARFPYPLAAAYSRHMKRTSGSAQAFQFHEGLHDLAGTIVQYLAAIVLCHYRTETANQRPPDSYLEKDLSGIAKPSFATWQSLLHTGLGLYTKSEHPLLRSIVQFAFDKGHRDDEVADAVAGLHVWLGLGEGRPPFANDDLFALLARYADHPQGWGARGTVLDPEDYRQRGDRIAAALERVLAELDFLTEAPLLAVGDASESGRLLQAMGTDVVAAPQEGSPAGASLPGHVLLRAEGRGRDGRTIDLHPAFSARKCRGCNRWIVAGLSSNDRGVLGWYGPACGHRDDLSREELGDLDAFISGRRAVPRGADASPYADAVRELLARGDFAPEDRQKLEFLARMLKIAPEEAAAIEDGILREKEQSYVESLRRVLALREPTDEDRAVWNAEAKAARLTHDRAAALEADVRTSLIARFEAAVREYYAKIDPQIEDRAVLDAHARELGLSRERAAALEAEIAAAVSRRGPAAPPASTGTYLELTRREEAAAPIRRVLVFHEPPLVLSADDHGTVVIRGESGAVVYEEEVRGRPYCAVAAEGHAFISTWEGFVYAFDPRELVWQVELGSPVSALDVDPYRKRLAAGTWAGAVRAFGLEGRTQWTTQLDDSVSLIAHGEGLTAAATYAGQIALLDETGRILWLRELPAPAEAMAFTPDGSDLIVVRRDQTVVRLAIADQCTRWEQTVDVPFRASALSLDRRRLALAGTDGIGRVFTVNDGLHLRYEHAIPGLAGLLFSPLSAEGRFYAASAGDQLVFVDNRVRVVHDEGSAGTGDPILDVAFSQDGRLVVAGKSQALELYRLARPRLRMSVKPLGGLRQGAFTRLEIKLANDGGRPARNIHLEFEGPVDCKPAGLPDILSPGTAASSVDQSMEPKASGAIPVIVKASYADDLDLGYEERLRLVLDVGG